MASSKERGGGRSDAMTQKGGRGLRGGGVDAWVEENRIYTSKKATVEVTVKVKKRHSSRNNHDHHQEPPSKPLPHQEEKEKVHHTQSKFKLRDDDAYPVGKRPLLIFSSLFLKNGVQV